MVDPRAASGLGFALISAVTFGLSGALARGLLDTGWSPGAVVTGADRAGGRGRGCRSRSSPSRGRWHAAAPQRRHRHRLRPARRRRRPVLLLLRRPAHAGRPRAAHRVHRARRGRGLAVAAPGPAPGCGHAGRRRTRRGRPGAGARRGLRRLRERARRALVARRDGRRRGVLPDLGRREPTASRRSPSPAVGLVVGAVALGLLALVGLLPMEANTDATSYAGREVAWWVPLVVLGLVTAAIAYVTGIAAIRRLGSRRRVVRGADRGRGRRRLGLAAPRRAASPDPARRRRPDPGRRDRRSSSARRRQRLPRQCLSDSTRWSSSGRDERPRIETPVASTATRPHGG